MLGFKDHFAILATYKKKYDANILVFVGGRAETGGQFKEARVRVASEGYYTMTSNSDGSANMEGINTLV
eukprot:Ihof_evm6s560 gene=Ihof_evmTU6s560